MIQKISNNEYLKRLNNMTAVEKEEYLNRVGEWLSTQAPLLVAKMEEPSARFQNIMQCSDAWNDDICKAWTEGARLLTAYAATGETWLPDMLYTKAARRCIKRMVEVLETAVAPLLVVNKVAEVDTGKETITEEQRQRILQKYGEAKEELAAGTVAGPQGVSNGDIAGGDKDGEAKVNDNLNVNDNKPETRNQKPETKMVPVRPKHIDQYVHLLPQKTQERAAKVQGLLRELDAARENERKLMEANAHPDTIAQWARMATNIDNKLKSIFQELDEEWDKLARSGRVVVDDLGIAHLTDEVSADSVEAKLRKTGRPPMTEEQKAQKAAEREEKKKAEQAHKAALIRKWLIDKRNAKSDEQVKKWEQKYKEMVKLGGEEAVTDKVREAAEYYGIELR